MEKFDLINSEGPILWTTKEDDGFFIICDEWNVRIAKLSKYALGLFLNGAIVLYDSKQREWNYSLVDKNMKSSDKLTQYLLKVL